MVARTNGAATANGAMSTTTESPEAVSTIPALPGEDEPYIGVVTRATSFVLDAIVINLVAIITGLGIELVLSIFPVSTNVASVLKPIAGGIYIVWAGVYFVVWWSWTGQTLGARLMEIRLVTAERKRVKVARAVVRWVGMNLAMLPLFAGYIPILFGRRGFPDWLAKTLVLDAPETAVVGQRRAKLRAAGETSGQRSSAISPGSEL